MRNLYHRVLALILFMTSLSTAWSQCKIMIDQDFNHWNNRKYTVADAKADFNNKIKPWTASSYRGLSAPGAASNLIGDVKQETRIVDGTLRAEYTKNDAGGYAGGFLFDPYFDGVEEAYLEYKVKFDDNFFWATGGKLPGLGGSTTGINSETTGRGTIPSGCKYNTNGWSARLMWRRNRAQNNTPYLILYSYFAERENGQMRENGDCGDGKRIFTGLQDNKWYTIRQYIKMNTPGQKNGVVIMWINGQETYRDTKALIRNSGKSNLKINALVMNTYRGGSRTDPVWHSPRDEYAFFDDFKVWTGCSDPGDGIISNTPPTVEFDASVAKTLDENYNEFYVKANASDVDNNLSKVTFFIDGQEVRSESVAPYEWGHATTPNPEETLNLSPGTHLLKVVAEDDQGATAEATMTVTVTEQGVYYLDPIEDAYLQGAGQTRYDTEDLRVENGNRTSYLKFDVSGVFEPALIYAELELTVGSDAGSGICMLYEGDGFDWTEDNISGTNAPLSNDMASQLNTNYDVGNMYAFDVPTAFFAGKTELALVVEMGSGSNDVSFASKENTSYAAPRLKVKMMDVVLSTPDVNEAQFAVYPNPSLDHVFHLEKAGVWTAHDLQGALIQSGEGNKVDLSNFAPGTYFLKTNGQVVKLVAK